MSTRRTAALSLALILVTGCAARPVAPPEAPAPDCDRCVEQSPPPRVEAGDRVDGPAYAGARSRSLSVGYEEPAPLPRSSRWDVRRIGGGSIAGDASAARPRRTKKVDIDLSKAPFDEVMRLLGDTGKFNVVVEAPSAGDVTIRLRDVEPYDALVVIAETRGYEVDYRRGVVVVGGTAAK